jgi:uncharacterized protein (TIRG00374 family)
VAKTTSKSILQFVVLLAIAAFLIWLSLRAVADKKDEIINAFKNADYFWIIISMLMAFLSHFLRAYRWNHLLKPLGYQINLVNANCHVFVGYLANYGIPRMGEVSRCTLAAKYDKVPFEIAFGTVITERVIDFMLFIIIFLISLFSQFNQLSGLANEYIFDKLKIKFSNMSQEPFKLILLAIGVILLVVVYLLLRKKIIGLLKGKLGNMLKGFGKGIASIKDMKNPFAFVVLSFGIWTCYLLSLYFCMLALKGTADLGLEAALVLLLFGTFGVIFSPGGLGAYPAIVGGILISTYHVDMVWAFAMPWLAWTSQFLLVLLFGLLAFIVLPLNNKAAKL